MTRDRIAGVVLAAGPSRRFGTHPPKQLAIFDGQPLVRRIVEVALASRLSEVVVVLGLAGAAVAEELGGLEVRLIDNPGFRQGQSSSVRAGLAAVADRVSAAMFVPIDQPGLSTVAIDSLIDCYRQSAASIVVPTFAGQRGAPVVIDQSLFGELAAIEGDAGGRQIFARHEENLVELAFAREEPLLDVDTPDQLAALES